MINTSQAFRALKKKIIDDNPDMAPSNFEAGVVADRVASVLIRRGMGEMRVEARGMLSELISKRDERRQLTDEANEVIERRQ